MPLTPAERERAFNRARSAVVRGRTELMRMTYEDIARLLAAARSAVREILADAPTDYQRWSLPRLSAEIERVMDELAREARASLGAAAGSAWEQGRSLVDRPLQAALPEAAIGVQLPLLDTRQLTAMRAFMVDRIADISVQAGNKITAELGLVVIGARTPSEAIGAVTKILGAGSRDRARTIVRTELGRVFSSAAQARMSQAAQRLPNLKKQWRRSGKLHPRLHHDLADGQVRGVREKFRLQPFGRAAVELLYPRDPAAPAGETINCGCESIPYMDSWKDVVTHPGRAPGSPLLEDDGDTLERVLARHKPKEPA